MLLGQPPNWTKDAAEVMQGFLRSAVGQAALAHVASRRPNLVSGTGIDAAALAGAEAKGYEGCITSFLALAEIPLSDESNKPASDNYQDIDDESQWPEELRLKPQEPPKNP